MKCPSCQAENPEGAKFCIECGQSLLTEIICPKCGKSNPLGSKFCQECGQALVEKAPAPVKARPEKPSIPEPTSFAGDRYQVKQFLGEGGKKKVYLAHDTVLDRDIAFALIKTEKLDDEARQYYQEAIKVCTEMPFRPELALTRLQLAELLFDHYPDEKKEALEHLDFAINEFREMKMQPSLERALRHKDILKA